MNIKSTALLVMILAVSNNTWSQTPAPDTKSAVISKDTIGAPNIWLMNSNKIVVKQNGITVDRAFFAADKVYIGCNNQVFKKEDQINIMIYGVKGTEVSNTSTLLSEATKQKILKEPAGTRIIFIRGHKETFSEMTIILR